MISETRRNPAISRIMNEFDTEVKERLITMLRSAQERGDISRDADIGAAVEMLMVIADGVWLRRAVDPTFQRRGCAADVFRYHQIHVARSR